MVGWGLQFTFSYPHHTLLQSLLVVGVGLAIPLQLPTPHSTTITSGGGTGACDSPSVTHTTLYYNHFWWVGWGLGFHLSYPHYDRLRLLLLVGVRLEIPIQLPTQHSTTMTSGGRGGACDSPSVTHTTLYYNHFWWVGFRL